MTEPLGITVPRFLRPPMGGLLIGLALGLTTGDAGDPVGDPGTGPRPPPEGTASISQSLRQLAREQGTRRPGVINGCDMDPESTVATTKAWMALVTKSAFCGVWDFWNDRAALYTALLSGNFAAVWACSLPSLLLGSSNTKGIRMDVARVGLRLITCRITS